MSDWTIVGDIATRTVAGRPVTIRKPAASTLDEAIRAWEQDERARLARSMRQLGDVVDGALAKAARRART
ncbi:hypothetical protein J5X84_39135 [Streptosporangiaceae bacterium NEAU-GS5]|nr:hypothetical protein [Streptosporangiaceae bacterium NEAU-GS5]